MRACCSYDAEPWDTFEELDPSRFDVGKEVGVTFECVNERVRRRRVGLQNDSRNASWSGCASLENDVAGVLLSDDERAGPEHPISDGPEDGRTRQKHFGRNATLQRFDVDSLTFRARRTEVVEGD